MPCAAAQAERSFTEAHRAAVSNNPEGVELTIRFADGRPRFRQGEIVTLELAFTSRKVKAYGLDNRSYDRSGRLDLDVISVDPRPGVVDPLYDYYRSIFGVMAAA
jgi:hypothetical protein